MYKPFFILILVFSNMLCGATNDTIEKRILQLICNDIFVKNNQYNELKKLEGVKLIYDPVEGKEDVEFTNGINSKENRKFATLPKEVQILILKSSEPIIKLSDTIAILDTTLFFSSGFIRLSDTIVVNIYKDMELSVPDVENTLILNAVGVRGNNLAISFSKYHENNFYTYFFNLEDSNIKLSKTTKTVKMKTKE